MSLFGKITSGIAEVGQTIVEPVSNVGQSIYGAGKETFSERFPNPKSIGGPVSNIATGVTSTGMQLGQKFSVDSKGAFSKLQEGLARTIVGGLDPVFGKGGIVDISDQAKAGDYAGAIKEVVVDAPVQASQTAGQTIVSAGQSLTLPLLAVAGILLLK